MGGPPASSGNVRLPSPVPKGEGPGAPSIWFGWVIETGATRHTNSLYVID
jgi:hypothetical protein